MTSLYPDWHGLCVQELCPSPAPASSVCRPTLTGTVCVSRSSAPPLPCPGLQCLSAYPDWRAPCVASGRLVLGAGVGLLCQLLLVYSGSSRTLQHVIEVSPSSWLQEQLADVCSRWVGQLAAVQLAPVAGHLFRVWRGRFD